MWQLLTTSLEDDEFFHSPIVLGEVINVLLLFDIY